MSGILAYLKAAYAKVKAFVVARPEAFIAAILVLMWILASVRGSHEIREARAEEKAIASDHEAAAVLKAKLDAEAVCGVSKLQQLGELRAWLLAMEKDAKARDSRQSALFTKGLKALEAALKERPQCP